MFRLVQYNSRQHGRNRLRTYRTFKDSLMTEHYVCINVLKKIPFSIIMLNSSVEIEVPIKVKSVDMVLIAFQLMKDFVNLVRVLKMNNMC